ncbi:MULTISPECIES: flavin prenyltransferase UbiX [Pseudoalteromonas]|uniref:Flavin prenyltransferase UbiX n=1 Tax=Pseudoalteromonas ruthenica TaxID=151081 RepID=A0A0F4Q2I9_9GAMM|nr:MULTISPECIES: flavin prenyltransferase UbiX [Pseudoalteromonas]KJY97851.1 aromatic acid decarboxylase [Pseudoalteromonas ruthenica]KJZ01878.1 aromatic acid decarboxylase [Pseudoalteromonas ruthenica]MCG7543357.1 UbiX family flavin prenyltransferase [Pseudoalteromonas sp. MM17-2]MCG7570641.1 UbiX family flavin prenyltransferase [Pseudoalteromonas sp. CNC9-20]TMO89245.1 UbiX family flavin prenyltransferase [Pseudoalteromonas ruthenica]|tara:strand:+ start:3299 stop:3922 length:624 start_codon:yes stop_codon:yes gene_type:complete
MSQFKEPITLAFSGASGAPYGLRLLEVLLQQGHQVFVLISSAARVVLDTESNIKLSANEQKATAQLSERFGAESEQLQVFGKDNWFSPVASGSAAPKKMVVCPCSAGAVSAIAVGASDNLLERAADVVIKERGQLILVPRETPFNEIHLENMLKLSRLGVTIMPAAPGFYHQPQSIAELVDFMVARILDHLGIEQQLTSRWGYGEQK